MSLILDALKKLDREKKPLPGSAGVDIAAGILRPDSARPGRRILLYLAAASAAAAVAAAITYGVMGRPGLPPQSSPPSTTAHVTAPAPLQPVPPPAPQVEPTTKSSTSLLASPSAPDPKAVSPSPQREPGREARGEISAAPPKTLKQVESNQSLASPGEKNASQQGISKEAKASPKVTNKTPEPTPKETAAAPPLKLSGILWYDNPSQRRAVINGMALPEGSVIEGVRILEIHPARVRLSHNGRSFDISLSP
jgi:hypothetical protein